MRNAFLTLVILLLLSSLNYAQTIESIAICESVKSSQPVNEKTNFEQGERAYCWVKVNDATVGSTLLVDWQHEGVSQHIGKLSMKYAGMRTYTYKTMSANGNWSVVIKTEDGTELKTVNFTVGGAGNSAVVSTPSGPETANDPEKQPVATDAPKAAAQQEVKKTTVAVKTPPSVPGVPKPNKLQLVDGFQLEIENPSKVILPPDYDKTKKYPALIFLPPTGMSGEEMYINYSYMAMQYADAPGEGIDVLLRGLFQDADEREKKSFIVILPEGYGSTKDHSWQGFSACIHRYEQRILKDLETYIPQYNIDPDNIVLSGFSLGGDLSWAISNRYPHKFKGGIVMGSRCSYNEPGKIEYLAKKGARYYIVMGEQESEVRMKVLGQTKAVMDKQKLAYLYREVPGGEHVPATFEQLREGINYVLFGEEE